MAKRQPKQTNQEKSWMQRRSFFLKLGWALVIIISALFGYTYGYPIVAEGQVLKGILVGLAYGGGALLAILISFFLNRKLRGY